MWIIEKKNISIYEILGFLLVVSIWAFNEEKYITYPIKIIYIFVFGIYWLRKKHFKINKYQLWCIWMCIFSVFALIPATDLSLAIYTLVNVLQVFLLAFVLSGRLEEKKQIEIYLKYMVWGGVILLIRLLIVTPLEVWLSFERLGDTIGYNANDVGNKAAVAAIIALCFYRNKNEKRHNIYLIIFIMMLITVLFSGSRKSLLAVVLALIFIYTVGLENKKNIIFYIIGICIILFLGYKLLMYNQSLYLTIGRRIESMINAVFYGKSEASSIDLREKYMSIAWSLIKKNPILGVGLGNYAFISGVGVYCHCDYLEVMCSFGIPVAAFYYIPLFREILKGLMVKKKSIMDYSMLILNLTLAMSFFTMVMYISVYTQMLIALIYSYYQIQNEQYGRNYGNIK